ncbi:MAG: FxLYD domain-containing protein [Mogibacterium sp.]|nr:FxLYD domain-containing protein [Mogibacterium sp.]
MKKRLFSVVLCIIVASFLAACGAGSSKTTDELFISAEAKGLQARWDLSDQHEKEGTTGGESFIACVDAELNPIAAYKDSEFEDEALGNLATEYIGILEKSKELASDYYDKNYETFSNEYTTLNQRRSQIIKAFSEDYQLPIDEDHTDTLKTFIADANLTSAVQDIISSTTFELAEDDYGWKKYQAVVENTTDKTFDSFCYNINLVDKDGVVVETQNAYTENWKPGDKHRFEFSTEAEFDKIEIDKAEWY